MTIDPVALNQWKKHYEGLLTESRPQFQNIQYTIEDAPATEEVSFEVVKNLVK